MNKEDYDFKNDVTYVLRYYSKPYYFWFITPDYGNNKDPYHHKYIHLNRTPNYITYNITLMKKYDDYFYPILDEYEFLLNVR